MLSFALTSVSVLTIDAVLEILNTGPAVSLCAFIIFPPLRSSVESCRKSDNNKNKNQKV